MPSKKINDDITPDIERIVNQMTRTLPVRGLAYYKKKTPLGVSRKGHRRGNARRNTKLSPDKQTIIANYPYSKVLDEGLYPNPPKTVPFNKRRSRNGYSKQAPKGMAEPTEKYIAKLMRKILKGQTI